MNFKTLGLLSAIFVVGLNASTASAQGFNFDDAKITVGIPAYVYHPDDRPGTADWNDGWFENEGVFADLTWSFMELSPATKLRAGPAVGVFDNSIFDTSVFFGGALEIENELTEVVNVNAGLYAGGVTGYDYDVAPAAAPYISASYELPQNFEVGLRGLWFPAETIGGSDVAPSDAYIAAFTLGKRF